MFWKIRLVFCRQRPWSMPATFFFLTAPLFLTALTAPAASAATYQKTDGSTSLIESPPWTAYNDLSSGNVTNISGYGRLFGDVDLGASGTIVGDATGPQLYGDVSGSGTISGATLFGNLDIGSSPGVITLEDVAISDSATTTFEITGTDPSQFDRLVLLGTVALAGTAQITFDNFAPDLTDTFQLIDLAGGTASSWFSSVAAPEGWTLSSSGTLSVIPEPTSFILILIGLALLPLRVQR